jgi:hypothetical protein
VDAALDGAPLRCRTVSQTPTYDQLRGERINADVPAGEADPHPVSRPGRHRIRDDMPAGSAVSDIDPAVDSIKDLSGSATGDSNRSGKHQLRDGTPAESVVRRVSARRRADLDEDWSWFETEKPSLGHENNVSGEPRPQTALM